MTKMSGWISFFFKKKSIHSEVSSRKNMLKKTQNSMAPFYGWDTTALRLQPLRGGTLFFTIQFPEIPGTYFIDLGRMKG